MGDVTRNKQVMQDEYRMRFSSMEDEIKNNLDSLLGVEGLNVDQRWLNIGKTHIEQGFMALKRALYEGKRVGDP
jgi:hypothetical protein